MWAVGAEATGRITENLLRWIEYPGCQLLFTRDADWTVSPVAGDFGATAAEAVTRCAFIEICGQVLRPTRMRVAGLWSQGRATVRAVGADLGWETRLDTLRAAITLMPADTDLAMARYAEGHDWRWKTSDLTWPHVSATAVYESRPLLSSYVPDVSGMQLLTDAHLDRAQDLENWTVTPLGSGRHLVEHHDLAGWYADPVPDPELVGRAREDFGPMILTPEAITAENPWRDGVLENDRWRSFA